MYRPPSGFRYRVPKAECGTGDVNTCTMSVVEKSYLFSIPNCLQQRSERSGLQPPSSVIVAQARKDFFSIFFEVFLLKAVVVRLGWHDIVVVWRKLRHSIVRSGSMGLRSWSGGGVEDGRKLGHSRAFIVVRVGRLRL